MCGVRILVHEKDSESARSLHAAATSGGSDEDLEYPLAELSVLDSVLIVLSNPQSCEVRVEVSLR